MEVEPTNDDDDGYSAFEQLEQLATVNKIKDSITKEWDDMLSRHVMPFFELEIINDEYLLVNLELHEKGIRFSFDSDNKPVSFDGEIIEINNCSFVLPFEDDSSLDSYLEMIMENLNEGYLLPNNLDRRGE